MGNPKGMRPTVRCKYRSEDNIQIYIQETGWTDKDSRVIWFRMEASSRLLCIK
jgi:hypothetical protein